MGTGGRGGNSVSRIANVVFPYDGDDLSFGVSELGVSTIVVVNPGVGKLGVSVLGVVKVGVSALGVPKRGISALDVVTMVYLRWAWLNLTCGL